MQIIEIMVLMITEITLVAMSIISVLLIAIDESKDYFKRLFKYCLTGVIIGLVIGTLWQTHDIESVITFIIMGVFIVTLLILFYKITKKVWYNKPTVYYDDGTPQRIYITGDKHRNFRCVKKFCRDMQTRKKDILIVLGDSGFNYYEDERDDKLKSEVCDLNITLFCLHGNKENRPQNIGTYGIRNFCGGKVYYEPKYPNIYFAIDGEIYTFEGKKYMVVGGAHSVDKMKCLEENLPFFEDEMPDDTIKGNVEDALNKHDNQIYGMLTHTCPLKYLPTEMFMSTRQNAAIKRKPKKAKSKKLFKPDIDRSTEEWLDNIEKKLDYEVWFCGHYHIDKQLDKVHMMCHEIRPLHMQHSGDT